MFFSPLLQSASRSAISGTVAATQAVNAAAIAATDPVSGSAAAIQQPNTIAAVGTTATASTSGPLAATQQVNVAALVASNPVAGAAILAQAQNVAALAASAPIGGGMTATQKPNTVTAGGSVMNAMTLPAGAIVHFAASDVTPQGDNTALAAWTDPVSGLVAAQATGANQPKYRTNRLNGKPAIQFAGSQWLSFDGTGPLKTAIDSRSYSVLVAFANVAAASNGCLFGSNAGGNSFFVLADGTNAGRFDGTVTAKALPYASTAFAISGFTSNAASSYGGLNVALERDYMNGFPFCSTILAAPATSASTFGIGAISAVGTFSAKADITDIVVYDRELTPLEWVQGTIALCQKNSQPLPWGGQNYIDLYDGDSITVDINSGHVYDSYPYLVSQARGKPLGCWANFAIGGIQTTQSTAKSHEWTAIAAMLGIPFKVAFFEWVNEHNGGKTSAQIFADLQAYCSTVRSSATLSKIMVGSSTAYGSDPTDPYASVRGVYNGLLDDPTTGALSFADAYTAIHTDSLIGNANAVANNPTYFSAADKVHLTPLGYGQLANLMGAGMAALDASTSSFGVAAPAQQPNASAASGSVSITGSASLAQSVNFSAGIGAVVVAGAAAAVQSMGTIAASGSVVNAPAVGTAAATQLPNAMAGSGLASIAGFAMGSQAINVASGTGSVVVAGVSAITQAANSSTASGLVADPGVVVGTAAATQSANAMAAAGNVSAGAVTGSAVIVQAANAAAALGLLSIDGEAAAIQAVSTALASGTVSNPAGAVIGALIAAQNPNSAFGVGSVVSPGDALQLTPGFLASRRPKRTWSIKK